MISSRTEKKVGEVLEIILFLTLLGIHHVLPRFNCSMQGHGFFNQANYI